MEIPLINTTTEILEWFDLHQGGFEPKKKEGIIEIMKMASEEASLMVAINKVSENIKGCLAYWKTTADESQTPHYDRTRPKKHTVDREFYEILEGLLMNLKEMTEFLKGEKITPIRQMKIHEALRNRIKETLEQTTKARD